MDNSISKTTPKEITKFGGISRSNIISGTIGLIVGLVIDSLFLGLSLVAVVGSALYFYNRNKSKEDSIGD